MLQLSTGYDDLMQIKNSVPLAVGDWLGEMYSYTTMAKNIGFPYFLAMVQWLNVSYGTLYGLVIVLSGWIFTRAIRPMVNNRWLLLLVFTIVIFTPISYSAFYRIYRNALIPWSTLMVVSSFLALFLRRERAIGSHLKWSLVAFLSLMVFWTLREDSAWILPFVFVAIASICVANILQHRKEIKTCLIKNALALFPLTGIAVITLLISVINYQHYGIWGMNDRTQTSAAKVISLIYQIDDGETRDSTIYASRKTFELAIDASPTFQTVGDVVLSSYGLWAGSETDVKGDISQWALRFGVEGAGYYRGNGRETEKLYRQIAQELQEAFESGRLTKRKGIYLSSQTGALQLKDIVTAIIMTFRVFPSFVFYSYNIDVNEDYLHYEELTEADLTFFEDILNTDLARDSVQLESIGVSGVYDVHSLDLTSTANTILKTNETITKRRARTIQIIQRVTIVYRLLTTVAVPLACLGYVQLIIIFFKRKMTVNECNFLLLMTAVLLTSLLSIFVVSLFSGWITQDPTSFVYGLYTPSSYVLMTIFTIMGCLQVGTTVQKLIRRFRR